MTNLHKSISFNSNFFSSLLKLLPGIFKLFLLKLILDFFRERCLYTVKVQYNQIQILESYHEDFNNIFQIWFSSLLSNKLQVYETEFWDLRFGLDSCEQLLDWKKKYINHNLYNCSSNHNIIILNKAKTPERKKWMNLRDNQLSSSITLNIKNIN